LEAGDENVDPLFSISEHMFHGKLRPSGLLFDREGAMVMFLCMRTTVDIPDQLSRKLKRAAAERGTTMRDMILHAVQRELEAPRANFILRDASAGDASGSEADAAAVNEAIDALREPSFRQ